MGVTAVIVSRNDDYGGNLKERASYCLNSMINSFEEVVYVDWNSPTATTLIEEIEGNLLHRGKLKVVVVPKEFHEDLFKDQKVQKCIEVLGRNVGIRRAAQEIIISTNIDIIAPREIKDAPQDFSIMARRDINLTEVQTLGKYFDIQKIQDSLANNINKYGHAPIDVRMYDADDYSLVGYCGDFQVAYREAWHKIRGFEEALLFRGYADSHVQMKAALAGYNLKLYIYVPVFHIRHEGGLGGGAGKENDIEFMRTITETQNPETWGFSNIDFRTFNV